MDQLAIEMTEAPPAIPRTTKQAQKTGTRLILIVDDDDDTVASIASIGRRAGYRVLGAASGEECLSMLSHVAPDLIMLDVNMPRLDGFETCRRARRDPNGMDVPIAFLTARKAVEDVKHGVAAGGDEFIVKPFDARYLVERIAFMISAAHALGEHRKRFSSRCGPPGAWVLVRPRRGDAR